MVLAAPGDNTNYELLYKHIIRPGRKDRSRPTGSICDIFSPGDPESYPPLDGPHRTQSSSRRRWGWCKWSGSSSRCSERPGGGKYILISAAAASAEVVTDPHNHQQQQARPGQARPSVYFSWPALVEKHKSNFLKGLSRLRKSDHS